MEEKKDLMTLKDFKETLHNCVQAHRKGVRHPMQPTLITFEAVKKFKSVGRAFRRGHITEYGKILPHRPFGNTRSSTNVLNRKLYEQSKLH